MSDIPIEVFFIPIGLAIIGLIAWLIIAYLQAPEQKKTAPEEGSTHQRSQAECSARCAHRAYERSRYLGDSGVWHAVSLPGSRTRP